MFESADGILRQFSLAQMAGKSDNPQASSSSSLKTSSPSLGGSLVGLHIVQNPRTRERYVVGGADDGSIAFWSLRSLMPFFSISICLFIMLIVNLSWLLGGRYSLHLLQKSFNLKQTQRVHCVAAHYALRGMERLLSSSSMVYTCDYQSRFVLSPTLNIILQSLPHSWVCCASETRMPWWKQLTSDLWRPTCPIVGFSNQRVVAFIWRRQSR